MSTAVAADFAGWSLYSCGMRTSNEVRTRNGVRCVIRSIVLIAIAPLQKDSLYNRAVPTVCDISIPPSTLQAHPDQLLLNPSYESFLPSNNPTMADETQKHPVSVL